MAGDAPIGSPTSSRPRRRRTARAIAFSARGNGPGQWWRKGHSHLDESEIWIQRGLSTSSYEKVVDRGSKNYWPMWSGDGRSLFFMSDRSGAENIWIAAARRRQPKQVTQFRAGRVLWPDISTDGRTIVFERDFSHLVARCRLRAERPKCRSAAVAPRSVPSPNT